ncbi:MAG TPA: DUF488 family protein [Marmoricola sp.]
MAKPKVRVRRAYDAPSPDDGRRVLVDRLWPRGLSKERAGFDEWCKTVAPSTELRKWYSHDPDKFEEFTHRYRDELESDAEQSAALAHLRELAAKGPLTLITASKRSDISEATVLATLLTS